MDTRKAPYDFLNRFEANPSHREGCARCRAECFSGTLGLNFGDSRDLHEITKDRIRRFAEAARIPVSPLWKIVTETAEQTAENWKTLEHRDTLPKKIREAIKRQILGVAAAVKKQ